MPQAPVWIDIWTLTPCRSRKVAAYDRRHVFVDQGVAGALDFDCGFDARVETVLASLLSMP